MNLELQRSPMIIYKIENIMARPGPSKSYLRPGPARPGPRAGPGRAGLRAGLRAGPKSKALLEV